MREDRCVQHGRQVILAGGRLVHEGQRLRVAGEKLRGDQKIPIVGGIVQGVDRQDIRAGLQEVHVLGNIDVFINGPFAVGPIDRRRRVPGHRIDGVATRHFLPVDVRHEPVVVLHLQYQFVVLDRVHDIEGDPRKKRPVDIEHIRRDVGFNRAAELPRIGAEADARDRAGGKRQFEPLVLLVRRTVVGKDPIGGVVVIGQTDSLKVRCHDINRVDGTA